MRTVASTKHILPYNQGELRAFRGSSQCFSKVAPSKARVTIHNGCSSGGPRTQVPDGWSWGWACAYTQTLLKSLLLLSELYGFQQAKLPTAYGVSQWFVSLAFYNWQDFSKNKKHQQQPFPSSHQQKVKTLRRTAFSYHMLPSKSWVFLCTLTVISHIDMAAKRGLFDVLSCLCNGVSF